MSEESAADRQAAQQAREQEKKWGDSATAVSPDTQRADPDADPTDPDASPPGAEQRDDDLSGASVIEEARAREASADEEP